MTIPWFSGVGTQLADKNPEAYYHGKSDRRCENLRVVESLDDGQRLLAGDEARRYESLSEEERDAIWNPEA